mmetsp:Transcript_84050/g.224636  ORF Transcript_84050/g.224636 Transcript_84050/m.224636 type:complete len:213 (-) Transcript_84050:818-1456(-)
MPVGESVLPIPSASPGRYADLWATAVTGVTTLPQPRRRAPTQESSGTPRSSPTELGMRLYCQPGRVWCRTILTATTFCSGRTEAITIPISTITTTSVPTITACGACGPRRLISPRSCLCLASTIPLGSFPIFATLQCGFRLTWNVRCTCPPAVVSLPSSSRLALATSSSRCMTRPARLRGRCWRSKAAPFRTPGYCQCTTPTLVIGSRSSGP